MKAWEHIIHSAMLGTDKPMPGVPDLPGEVTTVIDAIDAGDNADKEDNFLKKAALIYNYRQCGFTPLQKQDITLLSAMAESQPYCSAAAAGVVQAILMEDSIPLIEMWLTLCHARNQLLPPDLLPAVLEIAQKNESIQPLVIACSGNRGAWLSGFNPAWGYFTVLPDEEIWQTGKPENRLKVLRKVREHNPAQALEWLQQTWVQESAAGKLELLKVLRVNANPADLPWLESLLNEKGQKVKEEILYLLKEIPGSSVIRQYEVLLRSAVILKKEKAMLGLITKTSLHLHLQLPVEVDERIFASGIQKLAGQKSSFTDEGFIIYQLISYVPPAFWEQQLEAAPAQVVEYFEKYAAEQVPALGIAIVRFKSLDWMPYILRQNEFYADVINLLPPAEQEKYLLRFIGPMAQSAIHSALICNQEWGVNFTIEAMKYMVDHPYEYTRHFFSKNINLIPVTIEAHLNSFEAKEPYMQSMWEKTRHHLQKLLSLKQQMRQAFHA